MIVLKGISKSYQLGKKTIPVLHDIDLIVQPGEFVVVEGPSGSGKTTLLNIIGCIDRPDIGTFHLGQTDVMAMSNMELAGLRNEKIGFVFQNFNLLPKMTVYKNVQLPALYLDMAVDEQKRRITDLLAKVNLADRHDHLPTEISGGEKQRVAIARALVNRPAVILADEPTGNLDSKTTLEILEVLRALNREGHTIILITHESSVAAFGTKQYILIDGKLNEKVLS